MKAKKQSNKAETVKETKCICFNTTTRNVNGSKITILLTKERKKYQEQKRR